MPIPLPDLDTRTWDDLVAEGRALIPRYAPGWTDHNLHDPGITLIDLLAWLVEMDVYALDRVPEASRRRFLALIGSAPRPPQAAAAILWLSPVGPASVTIPAGAYSWDEKFLGLQWGTQRRISGGVNLQGGDYYDGTHFSRRGNVTWRPNRNFAIDFSMTEDRIKLPGGHFTLRIFGVNSQYAFSSTLSWSNLVQYDNISESMGFNSRLHWIPDAGKQAFLVLNYGLMDPDKDNVFESYRADLSLKFSYTIRF